MEKVKASMEKIAKTTKRKEISASDLFEMAVAENLKGMLPAHVYAKARDLVNTTSENGVPLYCPSTELNDSMKDLLRQEGVSISEDVFILRSWVSLKMEPVAVKKEPTELC